MAGQREGILLLAIDLVLAGQVLGGQAHGEIGVGVVGHQGGIGGNLVAAHRHQAHGLGAAGDDDVGKAAHDALRRLRNRLQAGSAEAVDRAGRGAVGNAGAQGGDAGDVHSLLRLRHGAAQDDVFHFVRLQARHAGDGFLDGKGGQVVGPHGAQSSPGRLPHRGANHRSNHSFLHRSAPTSLLTFLPVRARGSVPQRLAGLQ